MKVWKGIALFAGGTLFGLWGIKMLCSKDAKKVYTHCTAGVLRAKDYVLNQATSVKENCCDIYEEAKSINEERLNKEKESVVEDYAEETESEDTEEATEEIMEDKEDKPKTTKKSAAKTSKKSTTVNSEIKEDSKNKKSGKKKEA